MRARSAKASVVTRRLRRAAGARESLPRSPRALSGSSVAQAVGEPRRAAGANAPHQPLAVVGEAEPDAASVVARANALEEPGALEPVDVTRQRGRRDALLGCELGEREAGAALHEPEKRRLPRRDAELLRLLAQLAREPQEHGPKVGRDGLRAKRNVTNH